MKAFNYLHYLITSRFHKYRTYFKNKSLYHGRLLFTHTNYIGPGSRFEGANKIGKDTVFIGEMGYGTYLGDRCMITAKIGRYTSIASEVASNPGIHPTTYPYVTTSPMFYSTQRVNGDSYVTSPCFEEYKKPVIIGNDCWICQKVYINAGITVGDGVIILPGSVVTHDVPPYAIVGGVPAKTIKYRYSEEDIEFLLKLRWWEKPKDWLRDHSSLFCDFPKFKEEFSK